MKRQWVQFQKNGPRLFSGDERARPKDKSLGAICELTEEMKKGLKGVKLEDWVLIDNKVVPRPKVELVPALVNEPEPAKTFELDLVRVAYLGAAASAVALVAYALGVF